jgi:hypothetical protein
MKLLKRALLVVLLLLVVGVAAVFVFLDPLVKGALEKGSTFAAGVDTKVGSVDASLLSGRFGLKEMSLANPPGFRAEPFFHLGSAHAAWQNGSILSKTLEIDELVVQDVEVNLERAGSGTNWGRILDNLGKLSSGEKAPEPAKTEPAAKSERSVSIKKIEIRNVHAALHLAGLPLAKGEVGGEVTVPSVVIENFRSDGSTTEIVAKLTRAVLDSILKSVLSAGHNVFPADILKDLGQGLEGQGDSVNDRAKNALDGVLKGAGDLFKKKK